MNEIFFLAEEAPESGYIAWAFGNSIFTEGETLEELKANIREAVHCHFEGNSLPKIIRMRLVNQETLVL